MVFVFENRLTLLLQQFELEMQQFWCLQCNNFHFSAFFSTGDYKNNNLFLVKLGWIFYTRPSNGLWWLIGDVSVGFRLAQLKSFEELQLACLQKLILNLFRSSRIFKIFRDLRDLISVRSVNLLGFNSHEKWTKKKFFCSKLILI